VNRLQDVLQDTNGRHLVARAGHDDRSDTREVWRRRGKLLRNRNRRRRARDAQILSCRCVSVHDSSGAVGQYGLSLARKGEKVNAKTFLPVLQGRPGSLTRRT
jgi:hypothetical protein